MSSRRVSPHVQRIQDTTYNVKVTRPDRLFGLATVWRGDVKVQVSNPSRTIVDVLDDPRLGGGIRHVGEVVRNYFEGEHRSDKELVSLAEKFGNGTVFKRLGYLLEALHLPAAELAAACRARMSAGISVLDPSGPEKGSVLRRWRLRVNVHVGDAQR